MEKYKKKSGDKLLAVMPVPKAFLKLALPAIAAQLINILYNSFRLLLISCVSGSFLIWLICMISPAAVSSIFTNDMDLIAYTNKSMRVYLAIAFNLWNTGCVPV